MFEEFQRKQTTTKRGFTYDYYTSPAKEGQATILMIHGFPSGAGNYMYLAPLLAKAGYGIILPNLLGYAPSSQPSDPSAYRQKGMAEDVVDILETEHVNSVLTVQHDHGCGLATGLLVHFPHIVKATVYISVGFTPPSKDPWNQAAFNAMTKAAFGYETNGYFAYLASDPVKVAAVCKDHLDSMICLTFSKDSENFKKHFCPTGALEEWLKSDSKCEMGDVPTATVEHYRQSMTTNMEFALNWYVVLVTSLNVPDAQHLSNDQLRVRCPTLYIGGGKDYACPPQAMLFRMKPSVDNLETLILPEAGHWIPELNSQEAADKILDFFARHG